MVQDKNEAHKRKIILEIVILIVSWMALSYGVYFTNQIWHFNDNLNWFTSIIGGAIIGFIILVLFTLANDFIKRNEKYCL